MSGKTDPEAAAVEAMEEAGVQGKVGSAALGVFRYRKVFSAEDVRPYVVAVYPLRVLIQLGAWPEAHQRERRWMTLDEAAAVVHGPDLSALIREFSPKD